MTPTDWFDQFKDLAESVARRYAAAVKRYSWDVDDCTQFGLLILWKLAGKQYALMGPEDAKPYITVCVRRGILREARRQGCVQMATLVEQVQSKQDDAVRIFAIDLIDSAKKPVVREYLRALLFGEGESDPSPTTIREARAHTLEYLRANI